MGKKSGKKSCFGCALYDTRTINRLGWVSCDERYIGNPHKGCELWKPRPEVEKR